MLLNEKRIYIVEDMPENIFLLQTFLRDQKAYVTVDWFADGDFNRVLKALPIDVILLDLMLPRQNGFDIFTELRRFPQLEAVPIVAVSAMEPAIAIPKAQALGFSGFIGKPIDFTVFAQQLLDIMDGKKVWTRYSP